MSAPAPAGPGNAGLAREINREMAKGAAWMVVMRFVVRALGMVSTVILARLLVPADFGLVAMAMMLYGFIEILGEFSFDMFLIQHQQAARDYYDTAWTLSILRGLSTALAMAAAAVPMAGFMDEPRLTDVVFVLTLVAIVNGFTNIGTVDFRKNLTFGKDFRFEVAIKLISFLVIIAAAFALETYWALVIGIAAGGVARVGLSYAMHPFRPRLSLGRWREIIHVSKWLLIANIFIFANQRSDSLIVGKIAGAASLGLYTVAYEIATLATTELIAPIRRAMLPGYARLAHDLDAFRQSFLDGLSLIVMLGAPAAVGLGLVADPFVRIFLGGKWLDAIPLLQALSIFALLQTTHANCGPAFLALGKARLNTLITASNVCVGIPLFIWATAQWGVQGTAWALVAGSAVSMLVTFGLVVRLFKVSVRRIVAGVWRTAVALGAMALAVAAASGTPGEAPSSIDLVRQFFSSIAVGAATYVTAHLALWQVAGRPDGAERHVLGFARAAVMRLRPFRKLGST